MFNTVSLGIPVNKDPFENQSIGEDSQYFLYVENEKEVDFSEASIEKFFRNLPKNGECIKLKPRLKNREITVLNTSVPLLPVPTEKAMEMIGSKYCQKYGITISVCRDIGLQAFLENLKTTDGHFPQGLIVTNNSLKGKGHVTPIIINRHQDQLEILNLDVVPFIRTQTNDSVSVACNKMGIPLLYSARARQADQLSCRVGALVVLRNALIDLQNKSFSLFDVVNLSEETVESSRYEEPGEGSRYAVSKLPYRWISGDQIYPKDDIANEEKLIRDTKSTNLEKRENPRTIAMHRDAYQREDKYKYSTAIRLKQLPSDLNLEAVLNELKGDGCEAETDKSWIEISWEESLVHNFYMIQKAFKFEKDLKKRLERDSQPNLSA